MAGMFATLGGPPRYAPINRDNDSPNIVETHSLLDVDAASDKSMPVVNDPRFMATNVIDKRLGAFDKMCIVSGLLTGTSLATCFELTGDLSFGICTHAEAHEVVESTMQLVAFVLMASILFMSLYSTLVSMYQSYYTYRLMTAGANGFELARDFYLDRDMVRMRHHAVRLLSWGLLLLMVSSGGLLYIKFARQSQYLNEKANFGEGPRGSWISDCTKGPWILHVVHPLGFATFIGFACGSLFLYLRVVKCLSDLFDRLYARVYVDRQADV